MKPIELKLADWNPPKAGVAQITQKMADMIGEKSGGKLKIRVYTAESLVKMVEVFRGVQTGVADISYCTAAVMGSPLELNKVTSLPFMGITSMEMASAVHEKLFSQSPEVRAEFKGLKVLGFRGMPLYHGHFVKKEVHVPTDIKGMKLIAAGPWVDIVSAAGGAPVSLGIGDWYMSLERGVVEGHFVHFPVTYVFKTLDLFKYHTMFGGGAATTPDCFIFNLDVWNSLPADLQKVIEDAIRWRTGEITKFDYEEEQRAINYAKSKKQTFIYVTPEEVKLWVEAAKPAHEKWITTTSAKGLPARKVYEEAQRIIKEHTK
jgi:TRAP-type C4-dicarboxylate transport system substrate-binding protein